MCKLVWVGCSFKEHCFNPRGVGDSLEEPCANSCGSAVHFRRGSSINAFTCIGFLGTPWASWGHRGAILGLLGSSWGLLKQQLGATWFTQLACAEGRPLRGRPSAASSLGFGALLGHISARLGPVEYVCMFVCLYDCMFVRLYVCMYVRTYVCMYVCLYVCMLGL